MDRREFLKSRYWRAGLVLVLSDASVFSLIKTVPTKKAYDGDRRHLLYGKHQAGITTPMQKALLLGGVRPSHDGQKKSSSSLKTGPIIVVN